MFGFAEKYGYCLVFQLFEARAKKTLLFDWFPRRKLSGLSRSIVN